MKYVVITIVPRLIRRPLPGESLATGIREVGCNICVIRYTGKLDPCWKHKDEHILWAENEEVEDAPISGGTVAEVVGVPDMGSSARTEELVEV